jgi:hypothetical protein
MVMPGLCTTNGCRALCVAVLKERLSALNIAEHKADIDPDYTVEFLDLAGNPVETQDLEQYLDTTINNLA